MLYGNQFCCKVSLQRMAPILDIRVKLIYNRKSNVRIDILVVVLVKKVYLQLIVGALVKSYFFKMVMAAILDILVKMIFQQQTDVRIGILVVDIVENMYFNFILAALVRKSIFKNGVGGHFGFGPLGKNACIFPRGRVSKFFIRCLQKSNQSSNHVSQRVVTGLGCWTQL